MRSPPAKPHEDAGRSGTHQVQRRGVRGDTAHHHRHIELVDELLEVQRLSLARHVLCRNRGAANDEHVDAGINDGLPELLRALR